MDEWGVSVSCGVILVLVWFGCLVVVVVVVLVVVVVVMVGRVGGEYVCRQEVVVLFPEC